MTAWSVRGDHVVLAVKVQPKSRRPGLQGMAPDVEGSRLKIGVNEAAEDGRANRAVCGLLEDTLALPGVVVTVAQGRSSREKTLHIEGDASAVVARLETLCKPG